MQKKFLFIAAVLFLAALSSRGQSKMLTGVKHIIFVNVPPGWVQNNYDQIPFFVRPGNKGVSEQTYMYVYGADYQVPADLDEWLARDYQIEQKKHPGAQVSEVPLTFDNIRRSGYETGRYKVITYTFPGGQKETKLVIECKYSIVAAVFSSANSADFDQYLPAFKELEQSLRISGAAEQGEN